jgi:hypothetical protein
MTKKIAILQSCYIPWKGYFNLINRVDDFVLYDDMQYMRRGWNNRNKIKTANGLLWLTIPVKVKGKYYQSIKDTLISEPKWHERHWKTIYSAYSKAKYFNDYGEIVNRLYKQATSPFLSQVNYHFLSEICSLLEISTKLHLSTDYTLKEDRNERLIGICKDLGATHYLSGPAAKVYIDENLFSSEGIQVDWMDYSHYTEYTQLYPPFEHHVSILDLIMNVGPKAKDHVHT